MTEFNNNNNIKFVPSTPKTYEVKYVEIKDQSNLSKLTGYLGIKTAGCSGSSSSSNKEVNKTSGSSTVAVKSTQAEIVASAIEKTSQVGGNVEIKTKPDGKVKVNYDSGK